MMRRVLRFVMLGLAGFACILLSATPMRPGIHAWPTPDLLFALCCFWVIRRPESAPLLLVAGLGLLADLILMRPTGIGALGLVVSTEILRASFRALRDIPLLAEWLFVSALVMGTCLFHAVMLWLSLGNLPGLREMVEYGLATAAVYPIVALFCGLILGVRHRTGRNLSYSSYLGGN